LLPLLAVTTYDHTSSALSCVVRRDHESTATKKIWKNSGCQHSGSKGVFLYKGVLRPPIF
jgi:hypothetical protein